METVELELRELKKRVERLERIMAEIPRERLRSPALETECLSEREQLLAELKAEGVIRDPLPEERALAAQWDALPEEEKRAHIEFMRSLVLDPPLSQIIIDNRR